jgi:hypothetical protein
MPDNRGNSREQRHSTHQQEAGQVCEASQDEGGPGTQLTRECPVHLAPEQMRCNPLECEYEQRVFFQVPSVHLRAARRNNLEVT